jgi:hypothetical protein
MLDLPAAPQGPHGPGNSFTSINLFLPPLEPERSVHPPLNEDLVKIVEQIESTREIGL